MPCKKINNNSELDLGRYKHYLDSFIPYTQKVLGYNKPFVLNLQSDQENSKKALGRTAFYDPNTDEVTIYVDGRHIKDIMRSIAHELVHHTQNCRGEFEGGCAADDGYAQTDSHLRGMEREAYEKGNMLFRDWEDGYKRVYGENIMKKTIKIIKEQSFLDYGKKASDIVGGNKSDVEMGQSKITPQQQQQIEKQINQQQAAKEKKLKAKSQRLKMAKAVQDKLVDIFATIEDQKGLSEAVGNIMRKTIGSSRLDGDIGRTTLKSLQKIIPLKGLVNTKRDAYRNLSKILKILNSCEGKEQKCVSSAGPKPSAVKSSGVDQKKKEIVAKYVKMKGHGMPSPEDFESVYQQAVRYNKRWQAYKDRRDGIKSLEESKIDFSDKKITPIRERLSILLETLIKKG